MSALHVLAKSNLGLAADHCDRGRPRDAAQPVLSWERMASDYDISRGGLLPLAFVVMAFAAYAGARLRANGEIGKRK